ncbi:hypothetical protein Mapa_008138 [Marchantia paleacea]|nr:hypothetical protein Mapa_008138 [Marchantia paleacea]
MSRQALGNNSFKTIQSWLLLTVLTCRGSKPTSPSAGNQCITVPSCIIIGIALNSKGVVTCM